MTSKRFQHLLLAGLLLLPQPVAPAIITVDGTTGEVAADGVCSLVEAMENANDDLQTHADCAAGDGADDIVLTVDVTLTEPAAGMVEGNQTGTPAVPMTSTITIEGNDHTIARDPGAPAFRIFGVQPAGQLTLNDVTVSGGLISNPNGASEGGGILNQGTLILNGSTVSGNEATGVVGSPYAMFAYGGGIRNLADATITNSTISGNVASSTYPSYMDGVFTAGGGIASGDFFAGGSPTLAIVNSTISGNTVTHYTAFYASAYGAGIYVAVGDATITNSTISGNVTYANSADVAAVGSGLAVADATVTLNNTTVSGNTLQALGMNVQAYAEAIGYLGLGTPDVHLYGSAIGNHTYGSSCYGIGGADGGGNLADDATCDTIPATLTGLDASLADNGGDTRTHALLAGSSAIDAAGDCGLTEDQRGVARPEGLCDTGSYELTECSAPNGSDVVVPDQVVSSELTFTTCNSITVADTDVVGPDGHLILRTAGLVTIENGFSVDATGRLTVDIDGTIVAPRRVP